MKCPIRLLPFLAGLSLAFPALAEVPCTDGNGTFRFLTELLPDGSTNTEYIARLVVVNADGPVSFSIDGGGDPLNAGLSLDPASGLITGRPTVVGTQSIVFCADDTVQQICSPATDLQITASGGGGNAGSEFGTDSLLEGRVGEPYLEDLALVGGVGPFVFGGKDLPPGLSLDGETGAIVGVPTAAGTFYSTFTIIDFGEDNKVASVIPITILPSGSDFRFDTHFLNNGEVGTPFCDSWLTANASGAPGFDASGLPEGLSVDPATGEVTGTPTEAGTFEVVLSATDGGDTITSNLAMIVAPSDTSGFYWRYFEIPAALIALNYDRQPPILVDTAGGSDVTHSVVGLPTGMSYDVNSGELAGTPTDVGIYPVTFTALDETTDDAITLTIEFLVLPPGGGDESQIPINFWVKKETLRPGMDGSASWKGQAYFNVDRTAANRFDPDTDTLRIAIGDRVIEIAPGLLTGTEKKYVFKTPSGVKPAEKVQLSLAKQAFKWKTSHDSIDETVPGVLEQEAIVGSRGFRLALEFDGRGTFKPPFGLDRTAFVVTKGKIAPANLGNGKAQLAMLLYDPNFLFDPTLAPDLKVRLLDGTDVVFERDFTGLGEASIGIDKSSGEATWTLKTAKDDAVLDVVKLAYKSAKGKLSVSVKNADIDNLPPGEVHLGVEITIGNRTYYTTVTFFETKPGKYSTKM